MKITIDKITIKGSLPEKKNPLPMFKAPERNAPCDFDETFTSDDKKLFAYETGFRVLPYKMQDSYSRNREELELKTVILENQNLKAVFLADFGARLISLEDKNSNRELLFKNSVFQPANLSTRDAWFSGGIEWNIGQFGHSVLTCEPLFFAEMTDDEGNAFLRVYEYERNRKIYFSIDFHLPSGAEQLSAHVRIVNNNDVTIPMYWWTNIAVRENDNVRIFSESDQLIYIKPESNITEGSIHTFGKASITSLPSLPGKDASYPLNFDFSSEYFFQNPPECSSPWEAAHYGDGFTFFERSTSKLQYRKMFCWGNHRGGRNWCDYLSEPGKGEYLEIQAGLAPTQVHGLEMQGKTTWEFTQIFGSAEINSPKLKGEWCEAKNFIKDKLEEILPSETVNDLHSQYKLFSGKTPEKIIHHGSGWGALENRRTKKSAPRGFLFPDESLGEEQLPWVELLDSGKFPDADKSDKNPAWMVDPSWQKILEDSLSVESENPWPFIHLGILLYENDDCERAVEYWQKSIGIRATPIAWRNLAIALKYWGESDQAIDALKRAVALEGPQPETHLTRELMMLLIEKKNYSEAWKYFSSLPAYLKDEERILSIAALAAFERGDDAFLIKLFNRSFAYIKEGETRLVDLWYAWKTRLLAEQKGVAVDEKLKDAVRKSQKPPQNIDFTMSERD